MSRVGQQAGFGIVLAALLLSALAAPASASTVLRFSPDQLATNATVIVHGKVLSKKPRRLARGVIVTDYRLLVHEALKGVDPKAKHFEFATYGGIVGDRGSYVPGAATFEVGEEVLVFLTKTNKTGFRAAVGLAQGKYQIRKVKGETLAFRDLEGLRLMDRKSGKVKEGALEQGVSFEKLLRRVKDRLKAARKGKAGGGN